ncbi:hypothetical protein PCANC_12878 [Puccinia coronata f. sp. avenae]|uniref:Uncharacterized protein n=1 Tax=Puccinia coronata f. sp. avenae TaxID=200324 RepID=A0A2N5VE78_9BASI|nr:hypothetical protein PCANC_12878 [Puccinia coronata f. sp. avenae]
MILILLILTVAGQSLGMASEKELVQNSAVTQGIQLACASHGALPHPRASVVDIPAESRAVKTDAEGLAHSLPSDDHESGPSKHVAITIDAEAAGGSYSNEVGQTSTLFTDWKEPESSDKAEEKQSTTAPITLTASNPKEEGSHGQMSLPTNELKTKIISFVQRIAKKELKNRAPARDSFPREALEVSTQPSSPGIELALSDQDSSPRTGSAVPNQNHSSMTALESSMSRMDAFEAFLKKQMWQGGPTYENDKNAASRHQFLALPALTGRTRQFERCSNSRVRPVVGQALSDRSTCRRVGQACPISSWDRLHRTSRDRSDKSVRPVGSRFGRTVSVRPPVEHGCSSTARAAVFDRLMPAV